MQVKYIAIDSEREMSNGFRCCDRTPLTDGEINFLKGEIDLIDADQKVFVFNDKDHINGTTCYNFERDIIYITRNLFPDYKTGSTHPRDLLTPRAVITHEYYGHRPERERYLKECNGEIEDLPFWKDEAYASINAAFNTPNLIQLERATLLNEAFYRAKEVYQEIVLTDDMNEILYGEWKYSQERGIVQVRDIVFISCPGRERNEKNGACQS